MDKIVPTLLDGLQEKKKHQMCVDYFASQNAHDYCRRNLWKHGGAGDIF